MFQWPAICMLKSNCTLYIDETQTNWFYQFIVSPKYLRSASEFFTSNEVYLANIFKKSNTGNPMQIQMQTKYKCSSKNELDLTMTEITEFK